MTQTKTLTKPTLELAEAQNPDYYLLTSGTLREFSDVITLATRDITKDPKKAAENEREAVFAIAEASARGLNSVLISDSTLLQNESISQSIKKAYGIKSNKIISPIELAKGVDTTLGILHAENDMSNERKISKHFAKEAPKIEDIVEGSLAALTEIAEVRGGLEAAPFLKDEIEKAQQAFDVLEITSESQELVAA